MAIRINQSAQGQAVDRVVRLEPITIYGRVPGQEQTAAASVPAAAPSGGLLAVLRGVPWWGWGLLGLGALAAFSKPRRRK